MSAPLLERVRRLLARAEQAPGHGLAPALRKRLGEVLDAWEQALDAVQPAPVPLPAGPAAPLDAAAPINLWCDGSCAPNPGPGGWGAIVEQRGARQELSGASPQSTNNIMEMTAAIEALRRTPEGATVNVTTDSRYLMDGITRWMPGWKRRNWRKADGDPVLNRGLWEALDALVQVRRVRWQWVQGHTGHPENERCDELANAARLRQ